MAAALTQTNGAAGTIFETITITNGSTTTCILDGYPGLALLDVSHRSMPLTVKRGCRQGATCPQPTLVTLTPRGKAVFTMSYGDVPQAGAQSCASSSYAEITPPNDYAHLVIPLSIAPCGAPPEVDVSAVAPST